LIDATKRQVSRIGILGDVHGDATRLEVCLTFLQSRVSVDKLLCTGDVVNLEADTEACCQMLQDAEVTVVRGNHDRWFMQNLAFYLPEDLGPAAVSLRSRTLIASLPTVVQIESPAGPVLLCHGLGENDMAGVYPQDDESALNSNLPLWKLSASEAYRWVINGHTHRRMVRKIDGLTLINPGTVCADPTSGFCVADFAALTVQFYYLEPNFAVRVGECVDLT
jgi:putative phosphoesterase